MNRTDRLYAITNALHGAGAVGRTAAWLAERFEVSTRTIKRDVAALEAAGVPIVSQDGRGGGYQLMQHAALPPVSFTAAEATAVAVALAGEPQLPFAADGGAALQKLLSAMTREQRAEAKRIGSQVWMRQSNATRRPASARLLDEALRSRTVAIIDYADGQGRLTQRRSVEPMAFVRTRHHWHLLAWCRHRRAGRWFRLDRVRKARATREPCEPRDLNEVFGEPPEDALPVVLRT